MNELLTVLVGDCRETLKTLPTESVQCCVTSPPYFGLRNYGDEALQIGLEESPDAFIAALLPVFAEVYRVLRTDGTLWLNLGDSYANDGKWGGHTGGKHVKALHCSPIGRNKRYTGLKSKDLIGIPWRVAFALQAAGWYLRSDIIWHKPNPMPESVLDRPTKSHEYIFLLTKSARYYYDAEAIKEPCSEDSYRGSSFTTGKTLAAKAALKPVSVLERQTPSGRNKRSVWTVPTFSYSAAHFATYPPDLIKPCIMAGSKPGDTVLDPFGGSGTTGEVALGLGRKAILCELNPEYICLIGSRCDVTPGLPL